MDDTERLKRGEAARRRVLGNEWVDRSAKNRNAFNDEWIDTITRNPWCDVWTRPHFDDRTRRVLVMGTMIALGLTAPLATQMLAFSGVAVAAEKPVYKPTKRGGGGALKVLWWQGPTLLNPHFAVGTKDQDGSRVFYEPLAGWDADGNLVPVLAAEIPSVENGGLSEEGTSVTWKLKQGVKWHDGHPFTADDCVFNWEYANP